MNTKGKILKVISVSAICAIIAVSSSCAKSEKTSTVDNASAGASVNAVSTEKTTLSLEDAIQIAVSDAEISRNDAVFEEIKLDDDDGNYCYNIEFVCNKKEYKYKIGVNDASIISKKTDDDDDLSETTASQTKESSYIGVDKAKEIALSDSDVPVEKASMTLAKLDIDDSVAHYDIEFICNGYKYDYEINAKTGDILDKEKEINSTVKPTAASNSTAVNAEYITRKQAKEIALAHAGIEASDAKGINIELDTDDIIAHYEVEFVTGDYEYEYKINAKTGAVINCEKEEAHLYGKTNSYSNANCISENEATAKAFKHANVSNKNAKNVKVKLKQEKQCSYYDIEFVCDNCEYEYEIDASTGNILKSETEKV